MLNSDWPIGPVGVAHPGHAKWSSRSRPPWKSSGGIVRSRSSGVDIKAGAATLQLITSYGARQDIRIHTADDTLVDGFDVTTQAPTISSWRDVDAVLSKTGARYSWQVAKINDGQCDRVAGTNTAQSLPLASIFKLYVLYAVADAIKAGTVSWDDQLTVTDKGKAVGSGMELPVGAHISVRTAAEKMIATSDNMATDMLIGKLGPQAIDERAGQRGPSRSGGHDAVSDHVRVVFGRLGTAGSCASSGSGPRRKPVLSCCSRPIPVPTNRIRFAPTCRPRNTARNGLAALRISAECTWRCKPAQSEKPRPSSRSWRPVRMSTSIDTNGPTSARKPAACRVT